ncbi:MAG TPA: phenylalanine--tRNA ligase subunit beta [Symbiobacteriaceae bacterium]|nr:phenylalanine--tRNA ligase subunit beta [Symbiobacteriaceae bacterium]
MRVSYNWLKDYVDFDLSPQELAKALTARGVVVETLTSLNPGVEGVVIGKVVSMQKHPNADTLWVCQVDVGGGRVLQILTGAQNVFEGAWVPAAIAGSKIPGRTMEVKALRGLESNGMLCSPIEIGMGDDADGIMILPPDSDLEPGMDAAEVLGMNDWVLELDLTANYASHAQSLIGVAQEVAAILGADVNLPDFYTEDQVNTNAADMIAIRIEAPELCSRYVGRIVRGVKVGPSPLWLQNRIRAAGMRPISNIVDISNFVMFELGQPLHHFDYAHVRGKQIIVRRAHPAEQFTTLDGQERVLDPDVLVIADAEGPVALAGVMGGLESEVTDATTEILIESAHFDNINNRRTALRYNLPSEAARRFTKGVDPSGAVRAADRAAQLIAALAGGTVVQGHVDEYPRPDVPAVIVLRTAKVNAHLGMTIPTERMASHLERLGMAVLSPIDLATDVAAGRPEGEELEEGDDLGGRLVWTAMHQVSPVPTDLTAYETWANAAWEQLEKAGARLEEIGEQEALVVVVPTRRLDISIEVDLVEEIARSEGYDAIPVELAVMPSSRGGRTPLADKVLAARQILAGFGLDEVLLHGLTHPRGFDKLQLPADAPERRYLSIANPLYEDRSILRTTLLPTLLDSVQYNSNRQTKDLAIFEMGHAYLPREGQQLPDEPLRLAVAMMGNWMPSTWNTKEQPTDYFTLKGVLEALLDTLGVAGWSVVRSTYPALHPGRQAALVVGGRAVGYFGELHPTVQEAWDLPTRTYVAELDFEPLAAACRPQKEYRPVPRFPAVTRDVALIVSDETPASRVAETIWQAGGELVESVALFDLYQGEHVKAGHRSLAYRITYRSLERTLTDADIEGAHSRVRAALVGLGAELRS